MKNGADIMQDCLLDSDNVKGELVQVDFNGIPVCVSFRDKRGTDHWMKRPWWRKLSLVGWVAKVRELPDPLDRPDRQVWILTVWEGLRNIPKRDILSITTKT